MRARPVYVGRTAWGYLALCPLAYATLAATADKIGPPPAKSQAHPAPWCARVVMKMAAGRCSGHFHVGPCIFHQL
jgi:hypothetical protein